MTFRALRKCVNIGTTIMPIPTAESSFADTGEPRAEAEDDDFVDGAASFFRVTSIADSV